MPTCSRCRVAYLDGETHKCASKSVNVIGSIAGAITGAAVGFVAVYFGYLPFALGEEAPFLAIMYGGPAGAIFGAIFGSRLR
jgi:hypothetical protein